MYGRMRAMWPMSEMMDWPSEGLPWPTEVLNEDFRQTEQVASPDPVTEHDESVVCA
jgi:hypothetical protein